MLKAQSGKAFSISGAGLASTFKQHGWIDGYRLFVNPVTLGGGKSMFPRLECQIQLQLLETLTFSTGVVYYCYQPVHMG